MKTVATNFLLFIKFFGNCVQKGFGRQTRVKPRIKHRNLRHVWQCELCRPNASDVGRVVQRRKVCVRLECQHDLGCDLNWFGERLATMHHPVPNRLNTTEILEL